MGQRGIDLKNMKAPSAEDVMRLMEELKNNLRRTTGVEDRATAIREVAHEALPADEEESVPYAGLVGSDYHEAAVRGLLKDQSWIVTTVESEQAPAVLVVRQRPANQMINRTDTAFRWLDAVLPKRVINEEIGDALEAMNRIANGCHRYPRLLIGLRFVVTLICVTFNCIRFVSASVLGKKAE